MNTRKCRDCKHYWPKEFGGGTKSSAKPKVSKYGVCLDRSIFDITRIKDTPLPPRAKTADLPDHIHKIILTKGADVMPHCTAFAEKGAR